MYWKTIFAINSFSLGLPFFAFAQACRSEVGGRCFNLAAVAQNSGVNSSSLAAAAATPGDMLESIFIYGLGLVGISALIMLVFGGLKYMTATDNPGQVGSAKETMRNAIFGLVLALLSFLILFTINPDLVQKLDIDYLTELKPLKKTDEGGETNEFTLCKSPVYGFTLCVSSSCPSGYNPAGTYASFDDCEKAAGRK